MDLPLALSVTEAAALVGVSRSTAYELARDGGLPTVRVGRRLVVPVMPLLRHLGMTPEDWRTLREEATRLEQHKLPEPAALDQIVPAETVLPEPRAADAPSDGESRHGCNRGRPR